MPCQVTPGCEWVAKGEGVATQKYDGTCVMFDGDHWWARREVKEGKAAPAGFSALASDPETGKVIGWEPVEQSAFAKYHAEALGKMTGDGAFQVARADLLPTGTYELAGPKINGNPEGFSHHVLLLHSLADSLPDAPRDFDGLAAWLHARPYEGIVWHDGPGGAMAKIKKRDFRAP